MLEAIILASSVLGYFISISLIITPFYKNKANNYLSVSLFILTSLSILGWNDPEEGLLEFLHSIMWEFLVAVTLFSYFLLQIEHVYLKKSWYKWLYFPFISTLIIETFLHLDFNFNLYDSSFEEEGFIVQTFYSIEDSLSFLYNVVLVFWARILIQKTNNVSKEKKRWLLRLNLFILSIIAIWLLSNLEDELFDSTYTENLLWVMLSFLSWWILYYGVFKLQIISQKDELHQHLISHKLKKAPKKINETKVSKILSQLYVLMEEEELYKNPLLSRLDLATKLEVSEGHLSQIINQEINKTIIQFINEYRIDTAKNLLLDTTFNKYSVEAIGLESGFKSKSVFYSTFKNALGMSPGTYRKMQESS